MDYDHDPPTYVREPLTLLPRRDIILVQTAHELGSMWRCEPVLPHGKRSTYIR